MQTPRFVVLNLDSMHDGHAKTSLTSKYAVLLSDYKYWVSVEAELEEWLANNGGRKSGIVIEFKSNEELIMFKLKWTN